MDKRKYVYFHSLKECCKLCIMHYATIFNLLKLVLHLSTLFYTFILNFIHIYKGPFNIYHLSLLTLKVISRIKNLIGDFHGGWMFKTQRFHCRGHEFGLIPGQGTKTKMLHTTWLSQKKEKNSIKKSGYLIICILQIYKFWINVSFKC